MDPGLLIEKFERMGARLKVAGDRRVARVRVDIGHDRRGEFYDLRVAPGRLDGVDAIDVRPADRHLLLMVRGDRPAERPAKFLCGHDERAWFVAAVPEGRSASNVRTAMEALKPPAVVAAQAARGVRFDDRNRRRNAAFVRQGEWFFVPVDDAGVADRMALRGEVLARSGGKPHRVELLYRTGGQPVYVNGFGHVITAAEFATLVRRRPSARREYQLRRQDMKVLVKGRVSHADHATLHLRGWHEVFMNTEHLSRAMQHVAFID